MAEPRAATSPRTYRYYDLVMAAFVTVLLCANVIGASKLAQVGGFTFGAGVLFFPISYVFGDILTEVYGYARARKVVWAGFGALLFASLMSASVLAFPPAPGWPHQAAFETVDRDLEDAARISGGSEWVIFAAVTLPLAWRGILAGTVLGFARAMGEFGATLMVAGNIPNQTQTLSIAIYDAVQAGNDPLANSLVLLISILTVTVLLIVGRLARHAGW